MEVIEFRCSGTLHYTFGVGTKPKDMLVGILVPGREFAFQGYEPELATPSRWVSALFEMFYQNDKDGKVVDSEGNEYRFEEFKGLVERTRGLPRIGELPEYGEKVNVVQNMNVLKDTRYARP